MSKEKIRESKKWIIAIAVQAVFILLFTVFSVFAPKISAEISAGELTALHGNFEDGGRMINDSFGYLGEFVKTHKITLPRGSYTVSLDCERNVAGNTFQIERENAQLGVWADTQSIMPAGDLPFKTTVWVWDSTATISASCVYHAGRVVVRGVEITSNNSLSLTIAVMLFGVLAMLNMLVWSFTRGRLSSGNREARVVFVALSAVALCCSLPLFASNLFLGKGQDLCFHLMRIEGIKEGLLGGQFPVRIDTLALNNYGYADPLFYPNLFLYPAALLRIIGVPLQLTYKVLMLALNCATVAISYISFNAMLKNRYAAAVGSAVYSFALYRFVNVYLRGALGESLAMAFLPLVLAGLYAMLCEPVTSCEFKRGWIYGLIGYSGVVQSHMLSCVFIGALTIVFCIVFMKRVLEKQRFCELAKTALLMLALNAWFLAPLLDAMRGRYLMNEWSYKIQTLGAFWSQIFAPLGICSGESFPADAGIEGEMPLALGIVVGLAAIAFVISMFRKWFFKAPFSKFVTTAFCCALAAIFASTLYFPWDALSDLGPGAAAIITSMQFPWRSLSIASVLLALCSGAAAARLEIPIARRIFAAVLVFAAALQTGVFMKGYNHSFEAYDTYGVSTLSIVSGEYLPQDSGFTDLNGYYPVNDDVELKSFKRERGNVCLKVTNPTKTEQNVDVSLLCYPGYEARDAKTGSRFALESGDKAVLCAVVPAGYSGEIEVRYVGRTLWHVAEIVSLATAAGIMYIGIREKKKNAPAKEKEIAEID
ncbi:MAG: hypothetical protein RR998_09420 [Oscillospiraceae bacterium]